MAGAEPNLYDRLSLSIIKTLEKRHGVCDIKLAEKSPCDRPTVIQWEQKYSCMMTDDLRSFYLTSNGFNLHWSVKLNDSRIPVGHMQINPIEKLIRIGATSTSQDSKATLQDVDLDYDEPNDSNSMSRPTFDHRSRIFELDNCEGYGKVCYVYRETKPATASSRSDSSSTPSIPASKADIWFLDRSLQWHFLADTFSNYFRMMTMHLGLPQWQYAFTDVGLSPQARQWYNMYSPLRLSVSPDGELLDDGCKLGTTHIDISRVFKGKTDKKKSGGNQQNLKKKPIVSSAKGPNRITGSSTQQSRPIR